MIVSEILDILDQLHTASIEFTVSRDKCSVIGLDVTIQCLLAEQKPHVRIVHLKNDVEKVSMDT